MPADRRIICIHVSLRRSCPECNEFPRIDSVLACPHTCDAPLCASPVVVVHVKSVRTESRKTCYRTRVLSEFRPVLDRFGAFSISFSPFWVGFERKNRPRPGPRAHREGCVRRAAMTAAVRMPRAMRSGVGVAMIADGTVGVVGRGGRGGRGHSQHLPTENCDRWLRSASPAGGRDVPVRTIPACRGRSSPRQPPKQCAITSSDPISAPSVSQCHEQDTFATGCRPHRNRHLPDACNVSRPGFRDIGI